MAMKASQKLSRAEGSGTAKMCVRLYFNLTGGHQFLDRTLLGSLKKTITCLGTQIADQTDIHL